MSRCRNAALRMQVWDFVFQRTLPPGLPDLSSDSSNQNVAVRSRRGVPTPKYADTPIATLRAALLLEARVRFMTGGFVHFGAFSLILVEATSHGLLTLMETCHYTCKSSRRNNTKSHLVRASIGIVSHRGGDFRCSPTSASSNATSFRWSGARPHAGGAAGGPCACLAAFLHSATPTVASCPDL